MPYPTTSQSEHFLNPSERDLLILLSVPVSRLLLPPGNSELAVALNFHVHLLTH